MALAIERDDSVDLLARHAADIVPDDAAPPPRCDGLAAYRRAGNPFFSFRGAGVFDLGGSTSGVGDAAASRHGVVRVGPQDERVRSDVRLTLGCRLKDGDRVVSHEHHAVAPASAEAAG